MALVSLSCVFRPFKSSVTSVPGGVLDFGARVVTLGLGSAAGAGREVADGGDVTAGCGVRDALVAGGGDGAMCPRPAQALSPRIAAAIIQICAADISVSPPISGCPCC